MTLLLFGLRPARHATPHVLCMRDRLQVLRVHATGIPAKMVEDEAVRNRTTLAFVDQAMGKMAASVDLGDAVTTRIAKPVPFPAPAHWIDRVGSPGAVVAAKVAKMFALDIAARCVRLGCNFSNPSAPTQAKSARIRDRDSLSRVLLLRPGLMARNKPYRLSSNLALGLSVPPSDWRRLTTSAHAQAARVGTVGITPVFSGSCNRHTTRTAQTRTRVNGYGVGSTVTAQEGIIEGHSTVLSSVSRPRLLRAAWGHLRMSIIPKPPETWAISNDLCALLPVMASREDTIDEIIRRYGA